MSIQHYAPGEVIDISPCGDHFESAMSQTLIRESHIEIFRFVLKKGQSTPEHTAAGAATIQCIDGQVELQLGGKSHSLKSNRLIYLNAGDAHKVKALDDSVLLITILLKRE